jgi:hypothetical protein
MTDSGKAPPDFRNFAPTSAMAGFSDTGKEIEGRRRAVCDLFVHRQHRSAFEENAPPLNGIRLGYSLAVLRKLSV